MPKKKEKKENKIADPLKWFEVGITNGGRVYIRSNFVDGSDYASFYIHYEDGGEHLVAMFKQWEYFIEIDGKPPTPKPVVLPETWGQIN